MILAGVVVNLILDYQPNLPDMPQFWDTSRTRDSQNFAHDKPLMTSVHRLY